MKIQICVGSSCHLKGSYEVIQKMKELIEKNKLEDVIELQASFCLGNCSNGVSAKADDRMINNLCVNNVEEVFVEQILPFLEK